MKTGLGVLVLLCSLSVSVAQEYSIGRPTDTLPAPVYLTRPTEGYVEVVNLPPVQDVRIVGGKPEGPMEVTGEVGLRLSAPIPVEISNPQSAGQDVRVVGPVRLDDNQPVRVWIDNSWNLDSQATQEFAAFAFQSRFMPGDERHRKTMAQRDGRVFHLTDLLLDVRPDAQLKVRLLTTPRSVKGAVTGVEFGEFPLAVLDTRRSPSVHFSTPVPITGEITVEVEVLSAVQGGYFSAVALGHFAPKP